jgi:hypothetical protein
MKVKIGPYKHWVGPYQIAEKILFWKDKYEDFTVYAFGDWLSNIKWLTNLCNWIEGKKQRTIKIHIDKYDTWNMDTTLAYIVVPMLKQLKNTKHGAPFVEMKDVPKHLRSKAKDMNDVDETYFLRWDWVMDEMIFAFESKLIDWEEQFWKKRPELDLSIHPEDEGKTSVPVRWISEGECDWKARNKYEKRVENGFRLFGKYYQSLWD